MFSKKVDMKDAVIGRGLGATSAANLTAGVGGGACRYPKVLEGPFSPVPKPILKCKRYSSAFVEIYKIEIFLHRSKGNIMFFIR